MKICIALLIALAAGIAVAGKPTDVWTPKIEFQLEESDYTKTLVWISGWSYALTEVGRSNLRGSLKGGVCLPPNGFVESRILVDALNAKFKGKRITSEEASPVLLAAATAAYGCISK
jgi:hypothetical protein